MVNQQFLHDTLPIRYEAYQRAHTECERIYHLLVAEGDSMVSCNSLIFPVQNAQDSRQSPEAKQYEELEMNRLNEVLLEFRREYPGYIESSEAANQHRGHAQAPRSFEQHAQPQREYPRPRGDRNRRE